jgi:hypothetical protein
VTITFTPGQGRQPMRGAKRAGVVVVLAAAALLVLSGVVLGVTLAPSFVKTVSAQPYALPADATIAMDRGSWVVFEQTGLETQTGPVTSTVNRGPRLTPDRVTVTDSAGTTVPTTEITSTQTVNQGGVIYTGAVTFTVPADGSYRVVVTGTEGQVLVAKDLGDQFASSAVWFGLLGLATVGLLVGVILILVGRRRLPGNVGPAPLVAPAGWYPDPAAPGRLLWWDGQRWHEPPPQPTAPQDFGTRPTA